MHTLLSYSTALKIKENRELLGYHKIGSEKQLRSKSKLFKDYESPLLFQDQSKSSNSKQSYFSSTKLRKIPKRGGSPIIVLTSPMRVSEEQCRFLPLSRLIITVSPVLPFSPFVSRCFALHLANLIKNVHGWNYTDNKIINKVVGSNNFFFSNKLIINWS